MTAADDGEARLLAIALEPAELYDDLIRDIGLRAPEISYTLIKLLRQKSSCSRCVTRWHTSRRVQWTIQSCLSSGSGITLN
jgi:hypothetical protein